MSDDSRYAARPCGRSEVEWAAALALALWLGWGTSAAAEPDGPVIVVEPPMQVYLVHSAEPGCEPQCPEWIAAQGKIEEGTAIRFKKVLRQIGDRKLPVLIDSSGGRVSEAFEIGRLIRAKGLDVVVSGTELMPCAASDTVCRQAEARKVRLGLPQAAQSKCASACAFVLAAGTRRLVGSSAFVGLHRIRTFRVLLTYRGATAGARGGAGGWVTEKVIEIATPKQTYDQIRRYFAEMGIDGAVMPLILATPADRLRWLTRGELWTTRLATHAIDGTELLSKAADPVPGPEPLAGADAASKALIDAAAPEKEQEQ
jgi:hypothetical protein